MKLPLPLLAAFLTVSVLSSCDSPDSQAEKEKETEDLKQRIDQLEQEKREEAERKQAATREELDKAKEQLQLALNALEKEQARAAATPAEIDVKNAGKAVVVPDPATNPPTGEPAGSEAARNAARVAKGDDYRIFFDELAPHGEWFGTQDYGYVWQPREVRGDREWRPYTRGRWLLSDDGWTWVSDEPFGWATYHYGRWALLEKHGWAWVPGDEWAPAWVSWRQGADHVGWAPLPPETLYNEKHAYTGRVDTIYDIAPTSYTFVPVARLQESIAPHRVPQQSVMAIVARSENVTDVRERKDGIYSGGPSERWLAPRLGGKVNRCRVKRSATRIAGGGHERLRGDELSLFAPAVRAPWNPAVRPQRISESWGRVSVVRGGGAMNEAALARYRGDMVARQEAARRAIEEEEIREALLRDRRAREEVARRTPQHCVPNVHAQLAQAYEAAREELAAAEARLAQPNLNPKQRAYGELALKNARKNFLATEGPYIAHMQQFHREEWARAEAARGKAEAERIALEEAGRRPVCQPDEHQQLERAYEAVRAQMIAAERQANAPGLDARQLSLAKQRLDAIGKQLAAVEKPYADHLLAYHPEDFRRHVEEAAKRKAAGTLADERCRAEDLAKGEAARVAAEAARVAEEARRLTQAQATAEAARRAEMDARARGESAKLEAAKLEAAKLEAAKAAAEAARAEAAQGEAAKAEAAKMEAAKAEAAQAAAEEERRRQQVCNPAEHRQLETAYKAARVQYEAARARMNVPNLNPKQLNYARLAVGAAGKKQTSAEQAYLAHLKKHHPEDHQSLLGERAKEDARRKAEDEASDARRLAAERVRGETDRARMEAERRATALAKLEAERAARERAKLEEMKRGEAERALAVRAKAEELRKAQEEAARKSQPASTPGKPVCSPAEHAKLETGWKVAQASVDLIEKRINAPNANPRQVAYARKGLSAALKKLNSAQAAYEAHMETHHPAEWKEILLEREVAAKKAKEAAEAEKDKAPN